MVLIEPSEYSLIKNAFEKQLALDERCICMPRYKNEKGNPVIFSSCYKDEILKHKEMEGCKEIVQSHTAHVHWVEMRTRNVLQDIDYPEDYSKLNV